MEKSLKLNEVNELNQTINRSINCYDMDGITSNNWFQVDTYRRKLKLVSQKAIKSTTIKKQSNSN